MKERVNETERRLGTMFIKHKACSLTSRKEMELRCARPVTEVCASTKTRELDKLRRKGYEEEEEGWLLRCG